MLCFFIPIARRVPHSLIRSRTILFIVFAMMNSVTRRMISADHAEEPAEHRVRLHVVGCKVMPGADREAGGKAGGDRVDRADVLCQHVDHRGAIDPRETDRRVVIGEGEDLVSPGNPVDCIDGEIPAVQAAIGQDRHQRDDGAGPRIENTRRRLSQDDPVPVPRGRGRAGEKGSQPEPVSRRTCTALGGREEHPLGRIRL